jgi:hypothetical protein
MTPINVALAPADAVASAVATGLALTAGFWSAAGAAVMEEPVPVRVDNIDKLLIPVADWPTPAPTACIVEVTVAVTVCTCVSVTVTVTAGSVVVRIFDAVAGGPWAVIVEKIVTVLICGTMVLASPLVTAGFTGTALLVAEVTVVDGFTEDVVLGVLGRSSSSSLNDCPDPVTTLMKGRPMAFAPDALLSAMVSRHNRCSASE